MTLKDKKEEETKKEEEEITVYSLSHSVVIYSETDSDEMSSRSSQCTPYCVFSLKPGEK